MAKRRFIEEATGEEYVHKAVWLVAKRQIKHAGMRVSASVTLIPVASASHSAVPTT